MSDLTLSEMDQRFDETTKDTMTLTLSEARRYARILSSLLNESIVVRDDGTVFNVSRNQPVYGTKDNKLMFRGKPIDIVLPEKP